MNPIHATNLILTTAMPHSAPDHSIYNALFWILVALGLLIAVIALKVVFEIINMEIRLWREKKSSKPTQAEKEKGIYDSH